MQIKKDDKVGSYTILDPVIGEGASGFVSKAAANDGKEVAIKFLINIKSDRDIDDFKREYRNLTGLKHPFIAQALDFGFHEGTFYLVSEFVNGKTLHETCYSLKPEQTIKYFLQVLEGLDFIHRSGLLHLDIKPKNILVDEGDNVKIIDLGVSCAAKEFENRGQGTILFTAPEIILEQNDKVDGRADLYSLAATMYYCLTRICAPFPLRANVQKQGKTDYDILKKQVKDELLPPSARSIRTTTPEYLDKIILRLLEKQPNERFYGNARAVMNAIKSGDSDTFIDKGIYLKPSNNAYIGRDDIVSELKLIIDSAVLNDTLPSNIYIISGKTGIGKSRLLNELNVHANLTSDTLDILSFSFPASIAEIKNFILEIEETVGAADKPLIIFIDNLDHALGAYSDGENIEADGHLMRLYQVVSGQKDRAIILFATCNLTNLSKVSRGLKDAGARYEECRINEFTIDELTKYIHAIPSFQNNLPSCDWILNLYQITGGVPAIVAAQLEEGDSRGLLFDSDGKMMVASALLPDCASFTSHISEEVENNIKALYANLNEASKEIIEIMGVMAFKCIETKFNVSDLSAILQSKFVNHRLSELVEKKIIIYDEHTVSFINSLFSKIAYDIIDNEKRGTLHDTVAKHLKNINSQNIDLLLLHTGYGTSRMKASSALIQLSRSCLVRNGNAKLAAELLADALILCEKSNLVLRAIIHAYQAEAFFYSGNYEEAKKFCLAGINVIDSGDKPAVRWVRALLSSRLITVLIQTGSVDEAGTAIDRALGELYNLKWPATANLINLKASLYHQKYLKSNGDSKFLNDAKLNFENSLSFEDTLPVHMKSRVKGNRLFQISRIEGESEKALIQLYYEMDTKKNNIYESYSLEISCSELLRILRRYDEALMHTFKAIELGKRLGSSHRLALAYLALANIKKDSDNASEAASFDRKSLAAATFILDDKLRQDTIAKINEHMGQCHLELNNVDQAISCFESVLSGLSSAINLMSAEFGLGEAYLRKTEYEKAKDHFVQSENIIQNLSADDTIMTYRYRIARGLALAYGRLGDSQNASIYSSKCIEYAMYDSENHSDCGVISVADFSGDGVAQRPSDSQTKE